MSKLMVHYLALSREEFFTSRLLRVYMADDISLKIFDAIKEIQGSNDPEIFVKKLLRDTLNWPIEVDDLEGFDFEDLGYDWNSELEMMGLRDDEGIQELFKIAKFPGWPVGVFVVKFGSNSIFTKGRGMTTPLRNLLRNLVVKARPKENHQVWPQDQLLFMCHHEHRYFEFARFTEVDGKGLPKMQTFGWGPDDGDAIRTLCTENLPHFYYDSALGETQNLEQIARAFDVQRVTKKFYSDYKNTFGAFKAQLLESTGNHDSDEIHRYVQLVFNRFLFLRFIEEKGWLKFGSNSKYLQNLFTSFSDEGKRFYKHGFLPMALEGLVEKGKQKSDSYGEVELIGGGLFDVSKFDVKFANLPNSMFKPIIGEEGLLYRYNFTVKESTPLNKDLAIDPEMIGTMFEELVTDRVGKGAFYTPRIVVSYMCKEGIKTILEEKTDIPKEQLVQLVDFENAETITIPNAKKIRKVLDGIKAIDPACGSGAYLLGLLQEIIKIHENLQTRDHEFTRSKYDMKLHIISRTIFGVDLDPFATQIAMLRLWLSLAVESEKAIQLPNLDFNIETGDSLLAPDPSRIDWFQSDLYNRADKLAEKKEIFLSTKENIEALRREIRVEEADIRAKLREQNDYPDSIDFRIHFAAVFSKNGGFDLVLANPPYVRHEEIPEDIKNDLFNNYSGGQIQPVEKKSDLYCYFYLRANQLLRPNGTQIFICSNTWLDVGFGIPLQEFLLTKCSVELIMSSEYERQFSSAAVNTIISKITKKIPSQTTNINFMNLLSDFENATRNFDPTLIRLKQIGQTDLLNAGKQEGVGYVGNKLSLHCHAPDEYFNLLEQEFMVPLKNLAIIRRGITSGLNSFFYIERSKAEDLQIEPEFLKPLLKSPSECTTYKVDTENSNFLVFICNLRRSYLANTKALEYITWGEKQVTKGRQKQRQGIKWPETASVSNRVNWYGISPRSTADFFCNRFFHSKYFFVFGDDLIDDQTFYGGKFNSFVENKILQIALLNSSIGQFMTSLSGRTGLGEGVLQYAVYEMGDLPVIDSRCIPKHLAREICNLFLQFSTSEIVGVDDLALNTEFTMFDQLIYQGLNLSEDFRNTIVSHVSQITSKRLSRAQNV